MKRVGLSLLLFGIVVATGCSKGGASPDVQSGANSSADGKSSGASSSSGPKRIVAYFPNWTQNRKGSSGTGCEYKVEDVDAGLLTHAIFAFAKIDPGKDRSKPKFKMASYNPEWDLGPNGQYVKFIALTQKHPHLKTLSAVGS